MPSSGTTLTANLTYVFLIGVLDVLWIASGASTVDNYFYKCMDWTCLPFADMPNLMRAGDVIQTSMAFAWLNAIIRESLSFSSRFAIIHPSVLHVRRALLITSVLCTVTTHIVMVLVLALIYRRKGVFVWKRSVADVAMLNASTQPTRVDRKWSSQEQYSMKVPARPYDSESLPPVGVDGDARQV